MTAGGLSTSISTACILTPNLRVTFCSDSFSNCVSSKVYHHFDSLTRHMQLGVVVAVVASSLELFTKRVITKDGWHLFRVIPKY